MDKYALQQELEALAGNAFNPTPDETSAEPMSITINRWQHLFSLSQDEAVDRIVKHRNNLTRARISDEHWDTVRTEEEARGFDREAYEYDLELQRKKAALPSLLPASENSTVTYLVELDGPIDSPEKVRLAAKLEETPPIVNGKSLEEGRPVWLCCIDGVAKTALLQWAADEGGRYEPTILVDPRSLRRR